MDDALLIKYIRGDAASEDKHLVRKWLLSSKENQGHLESLMSIYHLGIKEKIHAEEAWQKVRRKMVEPGVISISKAPRTYTWMATAAALLVVVGLALFWTLQSGQVEQGAWMPSTELTSDTLTDGSIIHLKAGGELRYALSTKAKGERAVELKGAAFFEVARDEKKAFVIRTHDAEIRVLGTSFYVETDAIGTTKVEVVTGKVSFHPLKNKADKILLIPGDKAETSADHQNIERIVDEDFDHKWHTRHLVFKRSRLADVIQTLNINYGVSVRFANPDLSECLLTATFEDLPFELVLELIVDTFSLSVTEEGDQIILDGDAC